jgi:FtsP/CotA-like multicopper oxidase with cupredoxin domain
MRTRTGLAIGTLAILALMSPSFAVEPGPSSPRETVPTAKKPSAFTLPYHATGDVVSVNKRAQSFTLKTSSGGTMLLMADADIAPQLSTLKKGERVKVSYKNSQGQRIATKIVPA